MPIDDSVKCFKNYFELLKALCEKPSLSNRYTVQEELCKDSIITNQVPNNTLSNQDIRNNIDIKRESDDASKDAVRPEEGENIIISSNFAGKAICDSNYGDVNNIRIPCTTTPAKQVTTPLSSPDTHQLVTSSSSEPGDADNGYYNKPIISLLPSKGKNDNSESHNANDGLAFTATREATKPDNLLFDYHKIKCTDVDDDGDERTTSTAVNNNSNKYPDDDARDYHKKSIVAFDAAKCNKHNNSLSAIRPITSIYLLMTRSMGLTDEDALNLVSFFMFL